MKNLTKGEKTRIHIIEAATEILFERGFYQITLSQIAKSIGLTQQSIYKYFDSMDSIIIESCIHWVKEAHDEIDQEGFGLLSAGEQLQAMVRSNLKYSQKNRKKDALLIGLYYYALSSSEAMAAHQKIKNDGIRRLHRLIVQGNRESCWDVKDPQVKANSIHSLLVGEVFKMIIEPSELKLESRIKNALDEIANLLSHV